MGRDTNYITGIMTKGEIKKKAKNCVMPGGKSFWRLPEIEHGFHDRLS